MPFKTELHCHTRSVSCCARISPAELAERYIAHGYTTVVLTEHINHATFAAAQYPGGEDWQQRIDYFMGGYNALKQAAGGRLHVLLGLELCFDPPPNTDYLIYGCEEEHVRALTDLLFDDLHTVAERVHKAGLFFAQAHPFRNGIKVTDPALLDGIEVYNGNLCIDSRNDFARMWADRFDLIPLSGTDTHHADRPINGGIVTDTPITTNEELLKVLRERRYSLLQDGIEVPL